MEKMSRYPDDKKVLSSYETVSRIMTVYSYLLSFVVTVPVLGWLIVLYYVGDRGVKVFFRSRRMGTDMKWIVLGAAGYFVANVLAFVVSGNPLITFIVFTADLFFNIWLARAVVLGRLMHVINQ
jgi:hypothetical protein